MSETILRNLVDLACWRANSHPHRIAYTYLGDTEATETHITYSELDKRARAIGALLQSLGAAGERVLLLCPPGLEYISAFFGCLYAGAVAVPAYPPQRHRDPARLLSIVQDSRPGFILTTSGGLGEIKALADRFPELKRLKCVETNNIADDISEEWQYLGPGAQTLAFLQYTSGSLLTPKGVMVTHENILSNQLMIQRAFRQTEDSIIVGWLPLYHDMGLIGNVFQPLHLGARAILMSPTAFLQRPFRWLQTISKYRATTSGGPNFGYEICLRRVTEADKATLDLSCWRVAFNGAEPVFHDTLEKFAKGFEGCGFRRESFQPCYGLAEATLLVSGGKKTALALVRKFDATSLEQHRVVQLEAASEGRSLVSCGTVSPEEEIAIVHPKTQRVCPSGEVGEIWVSARSIADGYWNQPEQTAQTFNASLPDHVGRSFLRTGDLGFLCEGELFVTGRLKDLVIIRGCNHYPQDIERTAELSHAALRPGCGVAFSIEAENEQRLVLVYEVEPRFRGKLDEVIEQVRRALAEAHELQVYAFLLVRPRAIPKTSSGKVRRQACRSMFLDGKLESLAEMRMEVSGEDEDASIVQPALNTQKAIQDWLVVTLAAKLAVRPEAISVNDPLGRYGLDSLAAIDLAHTIQETLQVNVPLVDLLNDNTLAQLASVAFEQVNAVSGTPPVAISPSRDRLPGTLSDGQQALWFLQQMSPRNTAYSVRTGVRILSELDVDALRRAFQQLVDRHASLRMTFHAGPQGPVQQVHERMDVCFRQVFINNGDLLDDAMRNEIKAPFDLGKGPLMRVLLLSRSAEENFLLLVVHHIISDFWSLTVLAHELGLLYRQETDGVNAGLSPLTFEYADFVRWQRQMLSSAEGELHLAYWQKHLDGEQPRLNLPTDRPEPAVESYRGADHFFELDVELSEKLRQLSKSNGATLYMTLLAAFHWLLQRYTGQDDILIGSPMAGRNQRETSGLIGYFVNVVLLKAHLSRLESFEVFLKQVRKTVLEAFEHQNTPLPLLAARLQPSRDPRRPSLFQALFALQRAHLLDEGLASLSLNQGGTRTEIGGLTVESLTLPEPTVEFDLNLTMAEAGGALKGTFRYRTDLFNESTIARMAGQYEGLLQRIVANPKIQLRSLTLLAERERRQVLYEWNDTAVEFAAELLYELFEAQVERTPNAAAVVYEQESLTYRELNDRANQLAHYLQRRGAGSRVMVGVCMERSLELVVALLGVLKAGGAYVPLDPSYPQERLEWMIGDARLALVLAQEKFTEILSRTATEVVCLDGEWAEIAKESRANRVSRTEADDLAYMIYTSGSSGRPKGVMISHRSIVNRLLWMQRAYDLQSEDAVLQKTPFSFDVSVWELFWPLIVGARLVLARPGGHQEVDYLLRLIMKQRITTLHFVPSMLQAFIDDPRVGECSSLRRVFSSGEALPPGLQSAFFAQLKSELHNLYGPTEAAVDVTFWKCKREREGHTVPIGRPIANTQLYVLDQELAPVPIGVAGQLCIGGVALARGYLGRPELTAEKFVPNPFGKAGTRLYQTGDVARFLAGGEIEYLGRSDDQVKIRGVRIELGEIEAVLREDARVKEALVLTREETAGEKSLVAYVVSSAAGGVTAPELRVMLKQRLPVSMVPSLIVVLEQLPLTASGKVDRQNLLAMKIAEPWRLEDYVAPRTPAEKTLAAIWGEVLKLERVSVEDNFFDLGGHSLLATQITSRIRDRFGAEVPLSVLFGGAPTVAAMTKAMEGYQIDQASPEDISGVLEELEGLSDEELRQMLSTEGGAA